MPRLQFIFRTSQSTHEGTSSAKPYEVVNTIITPHPSARQLKIEIDSSSATDILFEMTEYSGSNESQKSTILSTTSSRKRIREEDVVPTTHHGEEATKAGGRKKKSGVEGIKNIAPQKDIQPNISPNNAPKNPTASSSKPKPTANNPTPMTIPSTKNSMEQKNIPAAIKEVGTNPSKHNQKSPKMNTDIGSNAKEQVERKNKPAQAKPAKAEAMAMEKSIATPVNTLKAESEKTFENKYSSTAPIHSVQKSDSAKSEVTKAMSTDVEKSTTKIDNVQNPSPTKMNHPSTSEEEFPKKQDDSSKLKSNINQDNIEQVRESNSIVMIKKKSTEFQSSPKVQQYDKSFQGTRIAKNFKGKVVYGQVDSFNGTSYFCTFVDGKKMKLTEESFQEAVYVSP